MLELDLGRPRHEIVAMVEKLGGRVTPRMSAKVDALISTEVQQHVVYMFNLSNMLIHVKCG